MTSWVSAHVHASGDLGELLTGAVAPAVRKLVVDGTVGDWFFLRYWEGGPHLRIRAVAAPSDAETVAARLRDGLTDWPMPPDALAADEYRRAAAHLAQAEGRTEFERDPQPPGTVRLVPYEPEHDVYGTGATLAGAERHFVESSALALDVLEAAPSAGVLRGLAMSVNLVTLADHEPDLDRLAAAFRVAGGTAGPGVEWAGRVSPEVLSRMNDSYRRNREQVRAEIARAWRSDGPEPLVRWRASVRALRSTLEAAGDRFTAPLAGSPLAWYVTRLRPERQSVAAVLLRCTHLFQNRIGIGTPEEMHIGYLVARALAEHD